MWHKLTCFSDGLVNIKKTLNFDTTLMANCRKNLDNFVIHSKILIHTTEIVEQRWFIEQADSAVASISQH